MKVRDEHFEENALQVAGRSVDNLPALRRLAKARADAGGLSRPEGRDLRQEILEECADQVNYITWAMQEVFEGDYDADPLALSEALSASIHVFGIVESLPRMAV